MSKNYVEKLENWLIVKDENNTGKQNGYFCSVPECVVTHDPVFKDFDSGLVDYMRFGQTWPTASFCTSKTPDRIICPSFYVSFCDVAGGYYLCHATSGFNCEKGNIILSCFRIEENLTTEPAAGLLLKGLIDSCSQ